MKSLLRISLAALMLAPSLALASPYPVTVTDDRNVAVTFDKQPEKIAALSIFAADILTALSLPIKGMITYEGRFPAYIKGLENLVDYGDMTAPNLELMTKDGIDLTIGMVNYAGPFASELEAIGKFLAFDSVTLEDSYSDVERASAALGQPEKGVASNEAFKALLADYGAKAPGGVSALFVWSFHDTLYGYQDNLLPAEFLPILKATNVMGKAEGDEAIQAFVPMEAEDLLARDPDVLFLFVSHGQEGKSNPAYAQLRAVKEGRAFYVSDHYSQPTGPIARELVFREIAHLLYPDTFPAIAEAEGVSAVPLKP